MTPRSVRGNNPGNLRIGQPWLGLLDPSAMSPEQRAEKSFCVFRSADYGFRALALLLLNYQRKYKLKTIYSIISRFAPANENDTKAYVRAVSNALNVQPSDPINVENHDTLHRLCRAIAIHESGGWLFSNDDLDRGVYWALNGMKPAGVSV